MCVLYKSLTKKYMKVDLNQNYKTTEVENVFEATDISEELADYLLEKCSKKLKGFQKLNIEKDSNEKTDSENKEKTSRRSFKVEERRDIYVRDRGICGICGEFVPPDSYTVDHIIPISQGGGYESANLQCCCKKCNQAKADALPEDFYKIILKIIDFQLEKDNKKVKKKLKKIAKKYNISAKKIDQ